MQTIGAYEPKRSTSAVLGRLGKLDDAIYEMAGGLDAVESIGALIEFLCSHPWDLNVPQNPSHKSIFLEKLTEHKQRIRILKSKLSYCLRKLRSLKQSV